MTSVNGVLCICVFSHDTFLTCNSNERTQVSRTLKGTRNQGSFTVLSVS